MLFVLTMAAPRVELLFKLFLLMLLRLESRSHISSWYCFVIFKDGFDFENYDLDALEPRFDFLERMDFLLIYEVICDPRERALLATDFLDADLPVLLDSGFLPDFRDTFDDL